MYTGKTEVVKYHMDAVKNWKKIVEISKSCSVIFNNIDVGMYFDYAMIALAKTLHIPYVAGLCLFF